MNLNNLISSIIFVALTGQTSFVKDQCPITSHQAHNIDDEYYDENGLRLSNHIYKDGISTPVIFKNSNELSDPYIELNSSDLIHFYFDDLNEANTNYSYTIIHCDANWELSDLSFNEYVNGFDNLYINDYELSVNTLIPYVNYHLSFPNDDLKITKSGNYVLLIYQNDDKEDPVITQRFIVYENLVEVTADVVRPTDADDMHYQQEINFRVNYTNHYISDPFKEIKINVLQNGRWDNRKKDLQPQFIQNDELIYNQHGDLTFDGNNEYRYLNIKSTSYREEKIEKIENKNSAYYVYLLPEEQRSFKKYYTRQDLNGKFLIKDENSEYPHTEADYLKVHFALKANYPIEDHNLYVFGALTGWKFLPEFKMTYNKERQMYELVKWIKQGYHNYMYAVPNKNGSANYQEVEGIHNITENDYHILVYQNIPSLSYDRIIGYKKINSRSGE